MSVFSLSSRSTTVVLGVAVFGLLGLGAFFYFRTEAHAEDLKRRNLRQLARIGRSIEARVDNFDSILRGLGRQSDVGQARAAAALVGGLRVLEVAPEAARGAAASSPPPPTLELTPGTPTARLSYRGTGLGLEVEVELGDRLLPLLEPTFFDELFLADASGRVFLQSAESVVRLQRIPGAAGAKEGDGKDGVPATDVRQVEVMGEPQWLFLQPIRLHLGASGTSEWTLAGLVSAGRFRSEKLALHPTRLLVLSLLLAGAVLAWPFLKVWSMGPRERVEVMDVLFMGFSLLLGTGLVALALQDLVFYPGFKDRLDEQLAEVGAGLEDHLDGEVAAALEQLLALTAEYDGPGAAAKRTDLLADGAASARWPYPYLEMVFWADGAGNQQGKWTIRGSTTSFVSVADRGYFRRARDGDLWQQRVRDRRVGYALESIRSRTTGEALTAFAVPYPKSPRHPERDDWVAVLLSRPAALTRPLLPPGFGFAVIEPGGRTLWSSSPQRDLEENLFDETGDDSQLRSVVLARREECLDADYLGQDIRLATRPLAGTDLTLVTYLDKNYLRTTNFEALLFAFGLFLAYTVLLILLFLLLYLTRPTTRLGWAWPDRRRPVKHALLAVVMLLFGLELARQVLIYDPQVLLISAFLMPLVAAGLGLLILTCGLDQWRRRRWVVWTLLGLVTAVMFAGYRWVTGGASPLLYLMPLLIVAAGAGLTVACERSGERATMGPRTFRHAYLGGILASLCVLGGLPAALFFRSVYFEHLKLLVRHGQLSLVSQLEDRWQRQRLAYEEWPPLLARRLADGVDLDFAPFFDTCVDAAREHLVAPPGCRLPPADALEEPRPAWVHEALADYLPFLNETSVATRYLYGPASADGAWRWQALREEGGWGFLRTRRERGVSLTVHPESDPPPYRIYSHLAPFRPPWSLTWWLLLIAAAALLAGLVRFQGRRVFLIDLEPARAAGLDELAAGPIDTPLLVVCSGPCARAPLLARKDLFLVDLRALPATDGVPDLPPPEVASDRSLLAVDHADYRLADPRWNRLLLAWLEDAVFRHGRMVVLLVAGDLDFALAGAAPAGDDAAAAGERRQLEERWGALLGAFVKVTVGAAGAPEPFAAELAQRRAALLATLGPEGEADPARVRFLDEQLATLSEECAGHPELEAIGRRLAARSDLPTLPPGALLDQLREGADGHYREIWARLSGEEKLLLAQLAQGALVNPVQRRPLRRLLLQGLLVRDPELRLSSRSLQRFVEESVRTEDVKGWEEKGRASTWQQVRPALLFSLVAVAVFLFATQRQLFDTTMGFISAVTLGVPALLKLLTLLRKPGAAPDAGG